MKECKQIMLYLAGELNPQERAAFKRHLAACRKCRAELTLWQAAQEPGQAPAAPAPVVEALFAKAGLTGLMRVRDAAGIERVVAGFRP